MGRFDDFKPDERDLLLQILASHLQASPNNELAQTLLKEIKPPIQNWRVRLVAVVEADGRPLRKISLVAGLSENYLWELLNSWKEPSVGTFSALCAALEEKSR